MKKKLMKVGGVRPQCSYDHESVCRSCICRLG